MTNPASNRKASSVQNALFSLAAAAILCATIAFILVGSAGVELPSWLPTKQEHSIIEGRDYEKCPKPGLQSVRKGAFQRDFEKYLADAVPCRDGILVANAALQRRCIQAANAPFGFDCLPTKFESTYVEVPTSASIISRSSEPTDGNDKAAAAFATILNAAVETHPDTRFVFDQIDDMWSSSANPTYKLISKPYSPDWAEQHVSSKLDGRVTAIFDTIDTPDELFADWHSTDHHWRIQRALSSYAKIGDALGWTYVPPVEDETAVTSWQGATARSALDFSFTDYLSDTPADFSQLHYYVEDEEKPRGNRAKVRAGNKPTGDQAAFNAYLWYFGHSNPEGVYLNDDAPNDKTCLFIEQSYGLPLEPYIAMNYKRTICISPCNTKTPHTLEEYLNDYNVDDVVVQFGCTDYDNGVEKSPAFFGMPE